MSIPPRHKLQNIKFILANSLPPLPPVQSQSDVKMFSPK